MVEAVKVLQDYGVEPDIWKVEGLDRREQAEAVSEQARVGEARKRVGCIILGRGSDKSKSTSGYRSLHRFPASSGSPSAAPTSALPLKRFLEDPKQESAAIEAIAENYKGCVDTWQAAR